LGAAETETATKRLAAQKRRQKKLSEFSIGMGFVYPIPPEKAMPET
jgi:hypothetical protein